MIDLRNHVLIMAMILGILIIVAGSVTAASAATVKNSQINPANTNSGGLTVETLEQHPDISGNIVVYEKT